MLATLETQSGTVADSAVPAKPRRRKGRVAGEDPVKRQQILDGARRCFMAVGFEAASMNQIAVAAAVSKGTIYVYFEDKENLFAALSRELAQLMDFAQSELDISSTMAEALNRFGVLLTTRLTSEPVIKAQRLVLGVVDRLPKLAANFRGPEAYPGLVLLRAYLDKKVAGGELMIEDTDLAGRQFIELAVAGMSQHRLFCNMTEPPSAETIALTVAMAVDMFLAYYGRP